MTRKHEPPDIPRVPRGEHHHPDSIEHVPDPEHPTRWWRYVRDVAGDDTQLQIAAKSGIDKYHPTRWKQGWRPAAEFVVAFAQAYNRSPLEALVEAEYLTEEQAALQRVEITDLSAASDEELLAELQRRLGR